MGFNKLDITGGRLFRIIAKIIGFENTLRLRHYLK
jgi:hypothetical protein